MLKRVILLIEPDEVVRELLLVCLNNLGGWTVISSASTQENWDGVKAQAFDVIVLDGAVLEADSPHFLKDLSDSLMTVDIPIVLLIHHALWLTSEHPPGTRSPNPSTPLPSPLRLPTCWAGSWPATSTNFTCSRACP
jgi:hypothetical protein